MQNLAVFEHVVAWFETHSQESDWPARKARRKIKRTFVSMEGESDRQEKSTCKSRVWREKAPRYSAVKWASTTKRNRNRRQGLVNMFFLSTKSSEQYLVRKRVTRFYQAG
jgi:hypothetical protein